MKLKYSPCIHIVPISCFESNISTGFFVVCWRLRNSWITGIFAVWTQASERHFFFLFFLSIYFVVVFFFSQTKEKDVTKTSREKESSNHKKRKMDKLANKRTSQSIGIRSGYIQKHFFNYDKLISPPWSDVSFDTEIYHLVISITFATIHNESSYKISKLESSMLTNSRIF